MRQVLQEGHCGRLRGQRVLVLDRQNKKAHFEQDHEVLLYLPLLLRLHDLFQRIQLPLQRALGLICTIQVYNLDDLTPVLKETFDCGSYGDGLAEGGLTRLTLVKSPVRQVQADGLLFV